jgi:hypothetical protein
MAIHVHCYPGFINYADAGPGTGTRRRPAWQSCHRFNGANSANFCCFAGAPAHLRDALK